MSNSFAKAYSAVILTEGDFAYLKRGKNFDFLPGVEVGDSLDASPRNDITKELHGLFGMTFTSDWLRYIGITLHCDEYTPSRECNLEDKFVVTHYWLPIGNIQYIVDMLNSDDYIKIKLTDMVENTSGNILYSDALAAKKVLKFKNT